MLMKLTSASSSVKILITLLIEKIAKPFSVHEYFLQMQLLLTNICVTVGSTLPYVILKNKVNILLGF